MRPLSRKKKVLLVMKMMTLLLMLKRRRRRYQRQPQRWWVRPVLAARKQEGLYYTAMRRMREGDHAFFFKFYRMTPQMFDTLLTFAVTDLTCQNFIREPLEPAERLEIALSYLASGQDICSVALAYRVGIETARMCMHVTCRSLWARLKDNYMKVHSRAEWEKIAQGFSMRWQFPNCLGAVDGKHVAIVSPPDSGSVYFNYKGILMTVVDSDCKYTLIDVGAEGRLSDGGTFKNSEFGRALTQGDLDIPSLSWLPGSATNAPYTFVGDEAFQLREDFLRPYPARQLDDERRVFKYRLSRARRCAENAFGIKAARWRILLRTIHSKPKNVDFVIKAVCILHNFLTVHNPQSHKFTDTEDSFGNLVAGQWRQGVQQASEPHFFPIKATHCRNYLGNAAAARNLFAAYFCSSAGEVPWQWNLPGVSKEVAVKRLREQPHQTISDVFG
ncbi:uncharacterized protein [Dermacentor andersoni]|uniref:uncharacterized protein isoform X1 n=1 Tax=Dermacentor andersoni TaxID=34620 RepID=UPI00241633D1|nr:uncharacterized protein LOC126520783 isoform X1 [Dermacentor andersoni]